VRRPGRGRSRVVGLVLSDLENPFYTEVARGVETAAAAAGYVVMVCDTGGDVGVEQDRLHLLADQRVAGVLLTPAGGLPDEHYLDHFARQGTHVVLLGQPRKREVADLPWVYVDDVHGGRLIGDHLVGLGHRHIAFVHRTQNPRQQTVERLEGLRSAVRRHGLDPDDVVTTLAATASGPGHGPDVAREWRAWSPRPTAIVLANDSAAYGVLRALHDLGVHVPGDVSVAGYDDLAMSGLTVPSLTTVAQPKADLGRTAVELLLEEIQGGRPHHREVVFMPTLSARESTGPVPRAAPGT
jgi:LacI family transcriptional regulator